MSGDRDFIPTITYFVMLWKSPFAEICLGFTTLHLDGKLAYSGICETSMMERFCENS